MVGSGEASLITDIGRGVGRPAFGERPSDVRRGAGAQVTAEFRPVAGSDSGGGKTVADPQATREATQKVQEFVQVVQRDLQFSVDEESGRTVVTVRDSESGEVIRQIPPERILRIAEHLDELDGLLFRGSA